MPRSLLCGDHAALPCVVEDAARIDHGTDFSERLERVGYAVGRERVVVEVQRRDIPRFEDIAKALVSVVRVQLAGGHAVPEEDSREAFRDDRFDACCPKGDWSVFTGGAAAEVASGDDDFVRRFFGSFGDEALRVQIVWQADEGVGSQLFVLFWNRWNQCKVLGGYDLIGVDVVPRHIDGGGDGFCHVSSEDSMV